jgi:hypothetical protein
MPPPQVVDAGKRAWVRPARWGAQSRPCPGRLATGARTVGGGSITGAPRCDGEHTSAGARRFENPLAPQPHVIAKLGRNAGRQGLSSAGRVRVAVLCDAVGPEPVQAGLDCGASLAKSEP